MNTISSINGLPLPVSPKSEGGYNVILSDLDSDASGRSAETGVLMRYIIRKDVYKIELQFRGKAEDIRALRDMITPPRLNVVFWDIDKWITKQMYCSEKSQNLLPVINHDGWYDFSFNLIEY